MEYLSHFESAYLLFFVQKFSFSIRKQIVNPRKVYAADTGLVNVNSLSFSKDFGRKLENTVFIHLRKKYKEIFYFSEKHECDFIVFEKGEIKEIIQVCSQLNQDNLERELNGLIEALQFFKKNEGIIITFNQNERFEKNEKIANVIPFYKYFGV
jgi:predicted AAA+ superfamily ATPase